jgi:hypothetical protein
LAMRASKIGGGGTGLNGKGAAADRPPPPRRFAAT